MKVVSCGLLAISVVATSACSGERPRQDRVLVETKDSAGTRIVTTDTSEISERLRLATEPDWSISEITLGGDPAPLYDIRDAAIVDSTRIAISQRSTSSVLLGDPRSDDDWVELGRRGEGPAEMLDVRSLAVAGDTIRVLDPRRGRVLSFLSTGDFIRAHELPDGAREDLLLWSPFAGGEAVAELSFVPDAPSDSTVRGTGPLFVRTGQSWDSIGSVPGVESFQVPSLGGEAPAGARTYIAGNSDGLWIGDNASPAVLRLSDSGQVELIVRWPPDTSRDPVEISRAAIEAQIAEFRKMSEPAPGDLALLRSIPPSRRAPQFTGLVAGSDGTVWVGPYEAGLGWMWNPFRDGGQWMVVAPDGVISALVTIPGRFEPLAVSRDLVIGVRRDEFDVEWLEQYRLEPDISP
jgi:hypothetical protein